MINAFTIKGFKQFTDLSIEGFNTITLIGGKNNTGKTTILEAFFMCYDRGTPEVTLRHLGWRGIGSAPFNPDSLWSPIFYAYDMSKDIEMEINENNIRASIIIKHNKEFQKAISPLPIGRGIMPKIETSQQAPTMESLDFTYYVNDKKAGESHLIIDGAKLLVDMDKSDIFELRKSFKRVNFIGSTSQQNPLEDSIRFGELDIRGQTDIIVDVLKIIEPNLKSLTTISKGDHALIYGDIGLSRKIPLAHMGQGTAKLLSIILTIATNENGLVLVDEIENGWHYSLLPDVWKAIHNILKKYNCQLIATTHSYEMVNSLVEGLSSQDLSDVTYIRLDKEGDKIKPKIYQSNMLIAALEREWEIR